MYNRRFQNKNDELLTILSQESSNLISESSQMIRNGTYNQEEFTNSAAKVLALLDLAVAAGMLSEEEIKNKMEEYNNNLNEESTLFY